MASTDLVALGDCTDADNDTLTFAVTVGTLPPGTSLGGTGNKDWTGTPNTENESGMALTVSACDPAGDCDTFAFTSYIVNTWTTPNCVGQDLSECAVLILAAAPWRADNMGLTLSATSCSASTPGDIVSQLPAAATQIEAFDLIAVTTARACGGTKGGLKLCLGLTC